MGVIIGITGAIGSGKTTFARLLTQLEPSHAFYETSELVAEVADDFNRALSGELAFETSTNDIELINQALIWFIESITEKLHYDTTWSQLAITTHGLRARPELFQKILHYVDAAKQKPKLLEVPITADNKSKYRPLLQWIGGYLVAKLSNTIWYDELFRRIDLHDADKNLIIIGGVRYPSDAAVVRNRSGQIVQIVRPLTESDDDVTEAGRADIIPDIIVHNNGSLQQLEQTAERLWFDFSVGKPKTAYWTITP